MKKIVFVFVFAFLLTISLQVNAQWFWQNPLPQSNDIFSVDFVDENNGWAIGGYGTIIKTSDKGTTWIQQTSGTTKWLNDVSFSDINNGIVVGGPEMILRTTNSGTTWTQLTI